MGSRRRQLKLRPVFEKFKQYSKPQSNHILARYQLRCLKQNNTSLEEFVTKAKMLVDEAGYNPSVKEEMLRGTPVFGIDSDKSEKMQSLRVIFSRSKMYTT